MSDTSIVATQNKPPLVVLRERLEARKGELANALNDIKPDHFIRAVTTAAQMNPDIQACSFQSLWLACMRACRDGLLPDGREGAIVPYKSNAQWIPMYQGLLKKFRQSGMAKWITSDVVREGETFEHWVDQTGEHFKHIPEGDESKPIIKVYAAALTTDGAFYVAVMSMTEINKIKAMSKASRDDSPWKQWPGEMMKKTALRRLSKMLPAGRDFFEEEEEQPQPQPVYAIVNNEARQAGAAGALDQFAGKAEEPSQPEGGEVSGTAATGPEIGSEIMTKNMEVTQEGGDHISIAYERGRIAKQTGAQRRAMPGEYREEANVAEANAWLAGFDGKSYTNPETGEVHGEAAT
jgi:recombination protein RecT